LESVILMGKNTLIRKAIKSRLSDHPEWEQLLPFIKQNVGLVLTKGNLSELRNKLLENVKPASAKIGVISQDDVVIKKQITVLEPSKTSFFAALNIATKITRGCVEILSDVKICEKGKKVGSSEAALLQMLDIKPFNYGPKIFACFNGSSIFPPELLDFSESELFESMSESIGMSTVLSLAQSHPNLMNFPKVILGGFNNLVAVSVETNYNFKEAEEIKKYLTTISLNSKENEEENSNICSLNNNTLRSSDDNNENILEEKSDLFFSLFDEENVNVDVDDDVDVDIEGFF